MTPVQLGRMFTATDAAMSGRTPTRSPDTPTPTKRDRLDIWETKGKPMEGVKRELPLDITPTTRSRIDPFEARGRNIEGVNRGEPIPLTPVDMAKIAEELAKMKKQGMLGITR